MYGEQETLSILNLLIQHFFNLSRIDQSLQPGFRLTETEMLKLHFAVKELKKGKPIQYITGSTEFAGLTIKVTPDVLIPRPETEELVEKIVAENRHHDGLNILDIGTGSGCIALALKKSFPDSAVSAVDVSSAALKVAGQNKSINRLNISLLPMDILDKKSWSSFGKFRVIVSNPPYVRESEKVVMQKNVVNHEPHLALFVTDDNPLIFYRAIAEFAFDHLERRGSLWLEINEGLGAEVKKLLKSKGFDNKVQLDKEKATKIIIAQLNKLESYTGRLAFLHNFAGTMIKNNGRNGKSNLFKKQGPSQPVDMQGQTLKFPVSFNLKAVMTGTRFDDDNKQDIVSVFSKLNIAYTYLDKKVSKNGTYTSFTYKVTISSKDQMYKMYELLRAIENLKFAL